MEKKEEYKYYSTQRPVDIGTYPKSRDNPMIGFTNYDSRIPVEGGAFRAWGGAHLCKAPDGKGGGGL